MRLNSTTFYSPPPKKNKLFNSYNCLKTERKKQNR